MSLELSLFPLGIFSRVFPGSTRQINILFMEPVSAWPKGANLSLLRHKCMCVGVLLFLVLLAEGE
jgi:hypothetical protein